jgi:catechol 2,3-dioxygenase
MTDKTPPIDGVRGVAIAVPDPERTAQFYTEIWGLRRTGAQAGAVYLSAARTDPHVLALHRGAAPAVLSLDLTAPGKDAVDALHASLRADGVRITQPPAALDEPGGGYGFAFADPEGRTLRVIADAIGGAVGEDEADRPRRIAHVVLNTQGVEAISAFYRRALGFRLIDPSPKMTFLRCNADHHSVAFFRGEGVTLNHIAFVMDDPQAVMRGVRRLKDHGFPLAWGVGQHGVGDPVFAYFVAPDDAVIEYTAETSEEWRPAPVDGDLWQEAKAPSERFKSAQGRVVCAAA